MRAIALALAGLLAVFCVMAVRGPVAGGALLSMAGLAMLGIGILAVARSFDRKGDEIQTEMRWRWFAVLAAAIAFFFALRFATSGAISPLVAAILVPLTFL